MAKNRLWVLLFALAVVVYGGSQYFQQQRSNRFHSVLMDFLPKDVVKIDIHKEESPPFSIIRYENRWLLSQQNVNETASIEAVEDLLRRLRDIRTSALISQQQSDWEDFGLGPKQGILLCLHFEEEAKSCVRIGRYAYSQEDKEVQAYTRLEKQKEVFTINGLALSMFSGELSAFRHNQLLSGEGTADSLCFTSGSNTLKVIHSEQNQILINGQVASDSLLWVNYLQALNDLKGDEFADDINELSIDSLRFWQLTVYQGNDSLVLDCYRDTTRQLPYLLHSQQFPSTWISSDSTGLHTQLIQPWKKWINNHD